MSDHITSEQQLFRCSIQRQLVNKDNPAKAAFGWEPVAVSGEELYRLVTHEGRPFTSVFRENHRNDANWLETSIIALDFDGTDFNQLTYQQAHEDDFIKANALFIYPTASWAETKQSYRVVFGVGTPLVDGQKYRALNSYLMSKLKGADPACKDLARFFWGCNLHQNASKYFGNVLRTIQMVNIMGEEPQSSHQVVDISLCGSSSSVDVSSDKTIDDDPYISFFNGQMTEGAGRNEVVYRLAKELGKTNMTLDSVSALVVSLNNQQPEPLAQSELTKAFTNGWNRVRCDKEEEIELSFTDAYSARQMEIQPMEVLVEGLMHKVGVSMIAGSPGVGKSLLAMNLALAIASDQNTFLQYPIKTHGKVLWIDYEMTEQEFIGRLKKIPIIPPEGMFKYQLDAPNITDIRFLSKLSDLIEVEKPALLVVDNVTTSTNGDENVTKDVKTIIRPLQTIAKQYGINVLLVHHFRKHVRHETLNLDMIVGSGTFARMIHTAILMSESAKEPEVRILKAAKLRNWPATWKEPYGVKLQDNLTYQYLGAIDETEHLPQQFVETKSNIDWEKFFTLGEELSTEELLNKVRATGISASPATLKRWLGKAVECGELSQPRRGRYQRGTLAEMKAELQKIVQKHSPQKEGS